MYFAMSIFTLLSLLSFMPRRLFGDGGHRHFFLNKKNHVALVHTYYLATLIVLTIFT